MDKVRRIVPWMSFDVERDKKSVGPSKIRETYLAKKRLVDALAEYTDLFYGDIRIADKYSTILVDEGKMAIVRYIRIERHGEDIFIQAHDAPFFKNMIKFLDAELILHSSLCTTSYSDTNEGRLYNIWLSDVDKMVDIINELKTSEEVAYYLAQNKFGI